MKRMTMIETIRGWCDRAGHGVVGMLALFALLPALAAAADAPGGYKAQRFDVLATPTGGNLQVTETVIFEFQSGTFRKVWRDIPASRTDGILVIEARMDDIRLPVGEGDGHITVSGSNRVRVQWNFAPVGPSTHTFQLRYIARGAIYREGNSDVLRWRALPAEHRYPIDASRIAFVTSDAQPQPVESRRVGAVALSRESPGIVVDVTAIRRDGTVVTELRYPAGTVISALPGWQERSRQAAALAPRWLAGAAAILAVGLLIVMVTRQGYTPVGVPEQETTTTSPPEPLPAAVVAVLAGKGRTSAYSGMTTLIDLADRGVLTVRELRKSLGVRQYELEQVAGAHQLEAHEEVAIDIAFRGGADAVSLSRARGRLARGGRRFVSAVNEDLERRGFIDPSRKAVRDRLMVRAAGMMISAALGTIAAAALIPRFEGWPFVLPLALLVAGIVGIIMAASTSPLSDRGVIESARWRGFKRHLKTMAADRDARGAATIDSRWIVYGIAVGLAYQWYRYLKARPGAAPAWFIPAAADDGDAFAAFVGSHVASTGGHGGGGAGGAAGGGGSGAG